MTSPSSSSANGLHRSALCGTTLLLLLGSVCANSGAQPPDNPPVPTAWKSAVENPATTRAPLDTSALQSWWKRLGDPVLDGLIVDALKSSPDIRTALSRIEQARASKNLQVAPLLPSISAGTSARSTRTNVHTSGTVTESESYAASIDASWEIDLFGKQKKSLDAARAEYARSREDLYNTQASLVAEIATNYITLRANERKLAVSLENLALREQTHELTVWRQKSGTVSDLDALQSSASLDQTRAAIPALQAALAENRNKLALLLGLQPGALDNRLALPANAAPSIPSFPAGLALGIPADTLRQRPDLRAAELTLRAAEARTSAAKRSRLPSLTLSGSFGVDSLVADRLFHPEQTALALIGSLSAPLFDAGRIHNNITAASETERQALIAWESSVLAALSEVENALVSIRRTGEQLSFLDKAASAAHEAASLAALQYQAGMTDLATVLDTQRTELAAQDQLISGQQSLCLANISLCKALGGGWAPANAN